MRCLYADKGGTCGAPATLECTYGAGPARHWRCRKHRPRKGLFAEVRPIGTIAALFVDPRGAYAGLAGVELWDEARDARTYPGPHPVVAHPPCTRWCRLAGLVEARWGHKRGDDGGCFASALASVRRWGGVLEHPAFSDAWGAFDLNRPPTGGGWVNADLGGGWTCHVEQARYGHRARKATWLYARGVELPLLAWGHASEAFALVSWCRNRVAVGESRPRVGRERAAATPTAFRDVLLGMARSAQ